MELSVAEREKFGKSVNELRKQGLIPAELYGRGIANVHLTVLARDFQKVFRAAGENTIVNIRFGDEQRPVLIHEVTGDYLSGEPIHVDFYQVRMDEKIKARIPLEFTGEPPAVKEQSGVLNKNLQEIEIEALPGDLPHSFQADLSSLIELDAVIRVKDLAISNRVKILIDPETVVASVSPPVVEEEIAPEAPIDVSAVKVETEEKKAERLEKEKAQSEE